MYNRYLCNDAGVYTRLPRHEEPPRPQSPPTETVPPTGENPLPPPKPETESALPVLDRILEKLHLQDLDGADLMLLALLFFLFEEKADDELLIALGLLLIL